MSLAWGRRCYILGNFTGETVMREKEYVSSRNNFNKDLAKSQIHNFTIVQWLVSIVVVLASAVSLLVAGFIGVWSNVWWLSVIAAEFSVMLIIGLIGGPLNKADGSIHTLGEELYQAGDWHENLRSLYRKKWLNVVPDIFALLPGLFLFVCATILIVDKWRHWFPVTYIVIGNCALLLFAIIMMPITCSHARDEVKKQVEMNDKMKDGNGSSLS